jgi:hypothetical protein
MRASMRLSSIVLATMTRRRMARHGRHHRAHHQDDRRPPGRGVKSSDHEEGQRVAFFLKGVTVDTDEQGDPITAPVVIEAMAGVASKKKAVLPNGARVAISALEEAVGDLGVIPPARTISRPRPRWGPWINGATTPTGAASACQASRVRSNWP